MNLKRISDGKSRKTGYVDNISFSPEFIEANNAILDKYANKVLSVLAEEGITDAKVKNGSYENERYIAFSKFKEGDEKRLRLMGWHLDRSRATTGWGVFVALDKILSEKVPLELPKEYESLVEGRKWNLKWFIGYGGTDEPMNTGVIHPQLQVFEN